MPDNNRDSFLAQFGDPENLTLTKRTFIQMYGYELSYPGTAAEAIALLKEAGCSRAEEYYNATVAEQEQKQNEMYKSVAVWLKARKDEGVNKGKKKQEAEHQRTRSQILMSKLELLKKKRELLNTQQQQTTEKLDQ